MVAGDANVVNMTLTKTTLIDHQSINLQSSFDSFRDVIQTWSIPKKKRMNRALDDIADELQSADPDKNEVGVSLERVLKLAQSSEGFAERVPSLQADTRAIVSWLGGPWTKLLHYVGLTV